MRGRLGRPLWLAVGWLSVGSAAAGVVLPLLPTTPFLLLALFAFARSSPRLRTMLLEHPRFGPALLHWQRHGAIHPRAKLLAVTAMAAALALSLILGLPRWLIVGQLAAIVPVALFILSRPSGPAAPAEYGLGAAMPAGDRLSTAATHPIEPVGVCSVGGLTMPPRRSDETPPFRRTDALPTAILGAQALGTIDLDLILERACAEVAMVLDVGFAKVLEYLPEQQTLLIRAGFGWADDVVGKARIDVGLGSPAGFTLQTGQATIANDLAVEARFRMPEVLRAHGVRSAVNVLIKNDELVFGVLEADSRTPGQFDERDVRLLQGCANLLALAIGQNRLAARNDELTQRQELLFQELRHRTKNNNQMLLSLLHLRQSAHAMAEVRGALAEVDNWISILNKLDDLILASGDPAQIDLGRYVRALLANLVELEAAHEPEFTIRAEIDEVSIDSARARAVAIIINEFVTNSLKHALPDGACELRLVLRRAGEDVLLEIADDGPGLPDQLQKGTGFRLIAAMAAQLKSEPIWRARPGTCLRLRIPAPSEPRDDV